MVQNTVELRVVAITIAKEYVKDVKSLLEEAKKIEKYIQGNAIIPNAVEDPSSSLVKAFENMQKNVKIPQLPEVK